MPEGPKAGLIGADPIRVAVVTVGDDGDGSAPAAVRAVVDGRQRVDRVLAACLPDVSRGEVKRWIDAGRVQRDGRPLRARDAVMAGDALTVDPMPPPLSEATPDPSVLFDVLHEDTDLMVVMKPAGLVVHPARGHERGTLVNGLLARPGFERPPSDPRDPEGFLRPGIVHRIDKETSGVLVVARNALAREHLKAQLAAHSVDRQYVALTVGVPAVETLDTLHGRDPASRLRFTTRVATGRRAVTHVRDVEVLASGAAARVRCELTTGRTHQIRVHLREGPGTPLLADALYGRRAADPRVEAIARRLGRHALHAALLAFDHPTTGQRMRFEAPLPEDMTRALHDLRAL